MSELTDKENQVFLKNNNGLGDKSEDESLQNKRASILEKHISKSTGETYVNQQEQFEKTKQTPLPTQQELEKEMELLNLKAELIDLKNAQLNHQTLEHHDKEFNKVLDKLLPDFLHEISSPISSVEYSSDNLYNEYQKIISSFVSVAESDQPMEAFQKVVAYVATLQSDNTISFDGKELREQKKKFIADLTRYQIKHPQRAAEFLIASGVTSINEKLHWIIKQPQGLLLFDLLISLLSVKQSFSVLDAAKARSRYLVSTLKNYTNKLPDTAAEVFDLRTSIDTAIVLLRQRLKSCNFSLQYNASCFIKGNIQHIVHVWINLLSNAIEATQGTGTIEINVFKENNEVIVTVQDNGPGIPTEIANKIFTPYFTTKKNQGGTGIGLDICKNVIALIGGTLSVTSQPGKTTFTVRLSKYE